MNHRRYFCRMTFECPCCHERYIAQPRIYEETWTVLPPEHLRLEREELIFVCPRCGRESYVYSELVPGSAVPLPLALAIVKKVVGDRIFEPINTKELREAFHEFVERNGIRLDGLVLKEVVCDQDGRVAFEFEHDEFGKFRVVV